MKDLRVHLAGPPAFTDFLQRELSREPDLDVHTSADLPEVRTDVLIVAASLLTAGAGEAGWPADRVIALFPQHTSREAGEQAAAHGIRFWMFTPVRIPALLRVVRMRPEPEDEQIPVGPCFLNAQERVLTAPGGEEVRLTEKEVEILVFLEAAAPEPVEREVLLHEVWGYHPDLTTHTVETHIYRLRQKLPGAQDILFTGPGGYQLRSAPRRGEP